jgi:hypothetical protein
MNRSCWRPPPDAIDSDKFLFGLHDLALDCEAERQSADSSWVRTVDSSSIRIAFLKECKHLIRRSETPEWLLKPYSSTWFKDEVTVWGALRAELDPATTFPGESQSQQQHSKTTGN